MSINTLSEETARRLADTLRDTADSVEAGLARLNLDWTLDEFPIPIDEIEAQLADYNLERCYGCGWWCDAGELVSPSDDGDCGSCDDCRNERG